MSPNHDLSLAVGQMPGITIPVACAQSGNDRGASQDLIISIAHNLPSLHVVHLRHRGAEGQRLKALKGHMLASGGTHPEKQGTHPYSAHVPLRIPHQTDTVAQVHVLHADALLLQQGFDGHQLLILHFIPFPVDQPQMAVQPGDANILKVLCRRRNFLRCFLRAGNAQSMEARICFQVDSYVQVLLGADLFHQLQILCRGCRQGQSFPNAFRQCILFREPHDQHFAPNARLPQLQTFPSAAYRKACTSILLQGLSNPNCPMTIGVGFQHTGHRALGQAFGGSIVGNQLIQVNINPCPVQKCIRHCFSNSHPVKMLLFFSEVFPHEGKHFS